MSDTLLVIIVPGIMVLESILPRNDVQLCKHAFTVNC